MKNATKKTTTTNNHYANCDREHCMNCGGHRYDAYCGDERAKDFHIPAPQVNEDPIERCSKCGEARLLPCDCIAAYVKKFGFGSANKAK